MRRSAFALCTFLVAGCWSVDSADLPCIGLEHGLVLTESMQEFGAVEPIASLQVSKSGFYLLGFAPVIQVSLHEAVHALAELAKQHGADGVCNLRYEYSPPHPLKFIVFPVPDWSASVQVFGMAYRDIAKSASTGELTPPRFDSPSSSPGR